MITSTIKTFDFLPELTAELEAQTVAALNDAAEAGRAVADERATGITEFTALPARPVAEGYSAGIIGKNPIWRVFDKGSLGKRTTRLKRPNLRKDSWKVERKRSVYEAHRRDVEGKGIAPKTISTPARTAGRRALLEFFRGL